MMFNSGMYNEYLVEEDEELAKRQMLDDLQLAAELGNTLLERNKELEKTLRHSQNIIEDKDQEIEYLNKQTVALREVNESRLRIYEQLEVSIQDLERANHRLVVENNHDKKQIKTLCLTIENLETKCDELQKTVDEVTKELEAQRRQKPQLLRNSVGISESPNERLQTVQDENETPLPPSSLSLQKKIESCSSTPAKSNGPNLADIVRSPEHDEEVTQLFNELRLERTQRTRDSRRIGELEEQLASLLQENQTLEHQLSEYQRKEDMKSMHEEISTLEEVREGHLCAKCLRNIEERARDELQMLLDQEGSLFGDESVQSGNNSAINEFPYQTSISLQIQDSNAVPSAIEESKIEKSVEEVEKINPYRVLVEKYEALLEVKRQPSGRAGKKTSSAPKSLHEELQMSGDFHSLSTKDTDEESGHGGDFHKPRPSGTSQNQATKNLYDFSEAETSSSGFSDETSNKATQTDPPRPGSFLCTIADGEDCKFSIYDDASPIDSRFKNYPKYREIFKEIFTSLKKAADNKDEGEALPLLDNSTEENRVEVPVSSTTEDIQSDFTDECQSITSSFMTNSEISTTLIENPPSKKLDEPPVKIEEPKKSETKKSEPVLTPYAKQREPLDYLSVAVRVRKKSSSRKNGVRRGGAESPVLPLSPRVFYSSRLGNGAGSTSPKSSSRRRDFKPIETPARAQPDTVWNGSSMQFWASRRNLASPTPSQGSGSFEFRPSSASQDLNKLKRLDVTYAEVLRNADTKYGKNNRRK